MNTTLVNAIPADVEFDDGRVETVSVRKLEIEPLYRWCKFVGEKNSPALVRLCTGKPQEFFAGVKRKSFALLAKQCFELNFPAALELIDDPMVSAALGPILAEAAIAYRTATSPQAVEAISGATTNDGTTSTRSSETPVPSASAVGTGTPSSEDTPSSGSSPS